MGYKIRQRHTDKHFAEGNPASVITHVDLGTFERTKSVIDGDKNRSYNYYIRREKPEVIEFVPKSYGAWHAGRVNKPTDRARRFFGDVNPNKQSVGICYEGKPVDSNGKVTWQWDNVVDGEPPTDEQVQIATWLIGHLKLADVPLFSHKEIARDKPPIVKQFNKDIKKELKRARSRGDCSLSQFTFGELIRELVSRV
jgi:N-acetyl-anhydromuramyl-L-alanine amidase AmpD